MYTFALPVESMTIVVYLQSFLSMGLDSGSTWTEFYAFLKFTW
jgi:TRAP-type C4-dicarboxylate transport system permease small subunit